MQIRRICTIPDSFQKLSNILGETGLAGKKTDRRTLYTRMVLKEAFLELLAEKEYGALTVSALCERADVTRATFYLHYAHLGEVLDETLEEALGLADEGAEPLCQRAASDTKYRPLFLDEGLTHEVARRLYEAERERRTAQLCESCGLRQSEAETLFRFLLYGNFAVNKSLNWETGVEWKKAQNLLRRFIDGGIKSMSRLENR